nr:hypothetical protein [uncultured archaeon]
MLSALIAKGDLSFSDISEKLKEKGYGTPSKSTLFNAFKALPQQYLNEALKAIDEMVAGLYCKFNEGLNEFAGDNSSVLCDNLVKREYRMNEVLMRDHSDYFALVRILTNTILFVSEHTNRIDEAVSFIPERSSLLTDAEYDVDDNYFIAKEHRIKLIIKPRNVP